MPEIVFLPFSGVDIGMPDEPKRRESNFFMTRVINKTILIACMKVNLPTKHAWRIFFGVLGAAFLLIGILGIFIPLVPGIIFLALGGACLSRASERFYALLVNNKFILPLVQKYRKTHSLTVGEKIAFIAFVWAIIAVEFYFVEDATIRASVTATGILTTIIVIFFRHIRDAIFDHKMS